MKAFDRIRTIIVAFFAATAVAASAMGFPEDQYFEYDRASELEVDAGIFDVEIQGDDVSDMEIEVREIPRGFVVDTRERRGRVEVVVKGRPPVFRGVSGNPEIVVTLPVTASVRVETSTGDVRIDGVNGDVHVSVTTGDIDGRFLAGSIRLDATTGRIFLEESGGELNVDATTGDIAIDDFQGVMTAETTTGDIEVDAFRVNGDVSFESTTGDIDVTFQNAPGDVRVDASSTTGDIRIDNDRLAPAGTRARFTVHGRTTTGDQAYR